MTPSRTASRWCWKATTLLVALLLALGLATVASRARDEVGRMGRAWQADLAAAEAALARGDLGEARRLARAARVTAVRSRHWEACARTADVLLRIGSAVEERRAFVEDARHLYHTALIRARADRSVAGVLRAADAFAGLGDRAVALGALTIAEGLARSTEDRDRIERVRARWGERLAPRDAAD